MKIISLAPEVLWLNWKLKKATTLKL
jgi:hypothetical protein